MTVGSVRGKLKFEIPFRVSQDFLSLGVSDVVTVAPSRELISVGGHVRFQPAESVEEAVRREVWEESGIYLGRVVIHSTQPWPYPANLMIGAIGQATPDGEKINLGNDAELEDAKWFTCDEVREALRVGTSGLGEAAGSEYKEGNLRLPPATAIAHQLLHGVVNSGFLAGVIKM